ncbi:hypothetical protein QBC46DRAFT_363721 [Diplogelasinospora grovesii]|uniref:Transposase n=1 Tax=Diplogelasinospora grovesii TaxID=303347 RepID=A0AAN6NAZ7_9PEZI|nr:hypothetical protein QBC46DRAFT_363721 [Diplogelasinospora grovesii]
MKLNLNDFTAELIASHGPNQELTPGIRAAICTLVATSQSIWSIFKLFGISRSTVDYTIEHWKTYKTFDSNPRKGRPQALSRAEKQYILLLVKRNRRLVKKALVNANGRKTMFLDECSCQNNTTNPTAWKWDKQFVNLKNHKGGQSDLIVIERDYDAPRQGYTAKSYQKALWEGLLPHYDETRHFQQDNAKIHAYLKRNLQRMFPDLWNLRQNELDIARFTECVRAAWWAIPQAYIDGLIDGMPRRLEAVRRAKGWYIKY